MQRKLKSPQKLTTTEKNYRRQPTPGMGKLAEKQTNHRQTAQVVSKYRMRAQPEGVEGLQRRGKDKLKPEKQM
jgi:hypothetical protein